MPHNHQKRPITRDMVVRAWVGTIPAVILFGLIFPLLLWGWVWWTWFIVACVLIGAISTTMTYLTQVQPHCPYCRAELTSQSRICTNCGKEIFAACPACQTLLVWGVRFCPKCGANMGEIAAQVKETQPNAPAQVQLQQVVKFCPTCGEPISEGAKYCFRCGTA